MQKLLHVRPKEEGAALRGAPVARDAVLIIHGMGQQLPFQTLDAVAEGLDRAVAGGIDVTARTARVAGEWQSRLEFTAANREVHLHEAYWAPLTEGKISLRQVVGFLRSAGLSGLLIALRGFQRWSFGKHSMPRIPLSTPLGLLAALAVVVALTVVNAALAALVADRALPIAENLLGEGRANDTRLILNVVTITLVAAALATVLALRTHRHTGVRRLTDALSLLTLIVAGAALVLGAYELLALAVPANSLPTPLTNGTSALGAAWTAVGEMLTPVQEIAWTAQVAIAYLIRKVLVSHLGDVAIYIMPYRVDGFDVLRKEIRERVLRAARSIYASTTHGAATYERVFIVGHSLGSVIAYDTLNRLILEDESSDSPLRVSHRTRGLITFGSPLDKTAFIFSGQSSGTSVPREALAASVQPLIRDAETWDVGSGRPDAPEWVNIYSRWDPVSGPLQFYGPDENASAVRPTNLHDDGASTPLGAHVQYWQNPLVWTTLRGMLRI
jgi:hypothetical protein